MRNLKLTLEYDGTEYAGWQRQANGTSIQEVLETAFGRIEGRPVTVIGAGRTDAGVHALGQVATVRLEHPMDVAVLTRALHATIPEDIRVLQIDEVAETFHARHSATAKTYRYRIFNGGRCSPFERRYVWSVLPPLDVDRMMRATRLLEGHHDFAAFQSSGSAVHHTVRAVFQARWASERPMFDSDGADRPVLTFEIRGDGFLRHMVRAIVGTLVEIGTARRRPDDLERILRSRDRALAGQNAPAQGLFLVSVEY
ncbi:MAG: tRNA pseudouridine(38-40) synthase TruA [Acidobacteria bacterium]|nr:tRNA pseudouridine(38-40) synthase TruA [Acidobacteriota bacterium]